MPLTTLKQEILDKTPQSLGLLLAAKAVGTEDHRRMLAASARRVRESHVAMARAAGVEGIEMPKDGDEEMGDIIITGDIYGGEQAMQALRKSQPQPEQATQPKATEAAQSPVDAVKSKVPGWAKTAAIVAGTTAANMAGIGGLAWWMQPTAAAVAPVEQIDQSTTIIKKGTPYELTFPE